MSHLKFTLILLATVFVGASPVFAQADDPATVLKQLNDGDLKVDDVFYSLDQDGDKSVTAAEATGAWSAWVTSGDRNGDAALSISEFRTYVLSEVERIQNPTADPRSPGWMMTYVVVGSIVLLIAMFAYSTQAGVIARATTKEAIRQPVFLLLIGLGIVFLLLNTFLPFFTFGEDVKMLVDCGLATILITGSLMAVWTASTSISSEIEGKTAMTLLSKPINRRQFILGKYIGILQAVFWMLLPVVLVFLGLILYKIGYDAKEAAREIPTFRERIPVMVKTLPGLALILLEISVLAAVSVAISTRLPMIVNIVTTFAIFIVGHLTPVLVKAGAIRNEFVEFMARLIATILPSLEVFNMEAAVATGTIVPPDYLGFALLYGLAYCIAAILLAFLLFEDRDLA